MKVDDAIAEILKREGVEFITAYPVNPIIEAAARADIRTIIVRQERTGIHIADGYSRINSGNKIGVFASQAGPGTENSFGGVAQAYGDSVADRRAARGLPARRHERAAALQRPRQFPAHRQVHRAGDRARRGRPPRCGAPSTPRATAARGRRWSRSRAISSARTSASSTTGPSSPRARRRTRRPSMR